MPAALWEWLLERAVTIDVADHLCERLRRGDRLRVKLGLDPTAPDIHIGHLVQLDTLRAFQEGGHTVVLIIGDYTALIGDPSGRSETRPMLSRDQVDANAQTYLDQIFKVLDAERTEIHRNSEWLAEMTAADILRLLAKKTLQSVLQREDFAQRLEAGTPIGAHEILYPFNQGYDSMAIRADVEIGGTDQLFNLQFGRELQRAYGQEPQDIAVFPLLEGPDGRRMSKSLGNYIGIAEPPQEIYGKTMSIPDRLTETYLRLVSGLSVIDVERVLAQSPRDAKAALARRLVERLYGADAATAAEDDFDRRFRRNEQPEDVPLVEFESGFPIRLIEAMVKGGLAASKREARRLIEQRGVRINGLLVTGDDPLGPDDVVQVGKRRWMRIAIR